MKKLMGRGTNIILEHHREGKRPIVVLREAGHFTWVPELLYPSLEAHSPVVALNCKDPGGLHWQDRYREFQGKLNEAAVRHAAFIAFGAAASLVQALCLGEAKRVRSAVFVDPVTRHYPSAPQKVIAWLEERLPLGLPLRSAGAAFDGKPFFHRVRCPVLLVRWDSAAGSEAGELRAMAEEMPLAWYSEVGERSESNLEERVQQLARAVMEFQTVPAKCSQKSEMRKERSLS